MEIYAHRGFPFTGKQLCTLAYEMATRDKKRGFSPVKMTAGRCWLRGFYKRHPEVRSKVSVNLSVSYISAGGMTMPPLVIFKAARIKPEWRKAVPTGYMIRGSSSRYINAKLFQEYGEHFVHFVTEKKILTRDRKVLLLLDMHKSHLFNLGFMEFMRGHNVEVCCFPPHCTHVLQPLDDMPFALFKAEYQRQLLQIN